MNFNSEKTFLSWILLILLLIFISFTHTTNANYLLGPGDVLHIKISEDSSLDNHNAIIGDDGAINLGYAGKILLAGKTVDDAIKTVQQHLQGKFLLTATVSIKISFFGHQKVFAYGELNKVGEFGLTRNNFTIPDLISLAGGKTKSASQMAYIIRDFQNLSPFEILKNHLSLRDENKYKFFEVEQSDSFNILPGDFIFIPPLLKITVVGEVNSPGNYEFPTPPNIVSVVAAAKGLKDSAKKSAINIKRQQESGLSTLTLNYNDYVGSSNKTFNLQNGDVLIVPESWF